MKIALCIPSHGDTKAKFTQCLASMIVHTMNARIEYDGERIVPEIKTIIVSSSILPENRNRLVAEAIHWDADYMLWMDADHVFPDDALIQLLSHNLPVVGCNYSRRDDPTAPTASKYDEDGKLGLVWTEQGMGVEEVAHLGLGLCLIDMRIFGALEKKALDEGREHFWPLFAFKPNASGIGFIGEDVDFFANIRAAGIPIHCDHNLSWVVGHLGEKILTCAHALVQKERWLEREKVKMDKFKEAAK